MKFETSDLYVGAYLMYVGHDILFAEQGDRGANITFSCSNDEGLRLQQEFKSDQTAVADSPETVNPQKLANRVNNLYDSGRLQDALGEKGANDLFDHSLKNFSDYTKILRNRKVAATVGKYGAAALGLGAAGHYVGHMLSE